MPYASVVPPRQTLTWTAIREIQAGLERKLQAEKSVAVWDMFRNPVDRRRTILATYALTVQGASGAMYMIGELAAYASNQLHFLSLIPPPPPRLAAVALYLSLWQWYH